jgi:hypothetical protein
MQTKLIWVLALAATLVALHGAPGAAAVSSPVPPECEASDLSAAAQARCDFIARTPNICQRQGLSEDTQRWCDETRVADELVPPECREPDLSAADQARCDYIARTPNLCLRQGLSDRTQRWCDQQRFADEPHFVLVRLARDGAVRSVHLIVTETGEEVVTSYPYGILFAQPDPTDREVRVTTDELGGFLEGRPTPAGRTPTSNQYATGIQIGWNPSTGVTPGQCLNFDIQEPVSKAEQLSFQSTGAASSASAQLNLSATVSGGVAGFKASDSFSFSDQWQSSTNSASEYYNFYSLYTLNTSVPQDDPLTEQGQNEPADSFDTLCGSRYMSDVPVGMLATISINYGSSSQSSQTNITNSLTASADLNKISAAVSTANSESSSNAYFKFALTHYGGGTDASNALIDAFSTTNSDDVAFYQLCAQGNVDACNSFSTNMGQGATNALDDFHALVDAVSDGSSLDVGFFETFPNGVAGAVTDQLVTTGIPTLTISEVLEPYASELKQYLTLLNEISTLNSRVGVLSDLLNDGPGFNAPRLLDLLFYLDRLENVYNSDRTMLLDNLESCLAATSTNVATVCAPIINNQFTNAFSFYHAPEETSACVTNGDCFFVEQNTIALQYVASSTSTLGGTKTSFLPGDTFYIDELPTFAAAGSNIPIAGQAALVTYVDRPTEEATTENASEMGILALEPGEPISTENVLPAVVEGSGKFTLYTINGPGVPPFLLALEGAFFTTPSCSPTFTDPCEIAYQVMEDIGANTGDATTVVANRQIEGFFTP